MPNHFDVVVIGTGAAGLYAALSLPQHYKIALLTKDSLPKSASDWAQGGIAAAISADDSPLLHIEDTLKAGAGLCDTNAVKFLAEHASESIASLVDLGVGFDRHSGQLALTLEAAHSRRRVLHAADTTGRAVVSTLTAQILKRKNIRVIEQAFALNLWLNPTSGRCQGISLAYEGNVYWIQADAVVLATGGGGQVFAQTTNPAVNTGDGVAMAWRAGAILRDLEFVQFHPTALTKAGAPRFLISEAVRGEGAHLVDDHGYRFAFDYHSAGELAPRDIVSRAIFSHFQRTGSDPATANVWLDLRPIPPERIHHRFPNIIQVCRDWGIDVFSQPIPVAPAAHYWMGGIYTDLANQTSIPGLYAVGETASTGVHGANRLASNSLLECIVFGAQLAHLELFTPEPVSLSSGRTSPFTHSQNEQNKIHTIRQELPRLVWQSAGICRNQPTLQTVLNQIQTWQTEFAALPLSQYLTSLTPTEPTSISPFDPDLLRTWGETCNLLDIAYLILNSALFRTESRGGHYRTDFPNLDPNWHTHTLIQQANWWKNSIPT
ncbi:L-aspartate oxidase [Ancylothrix sp. C2]|nr:L-aspartate oxidase [Ancylothrix sp. D3o]